MATYRPIPPSSLGIPCPFACEKHPLHKLTDDAVRQIRKSSDSDHTTSSTVWACQLLRYGAARERAPR